MDLMRGVEQVAGLAAGLVLLALPAVAAAGPEPAPEAELAAALRQVRSGQHAAAIPLLRRALAAAPDDLELRLLLGICYYRTGELGPAEAHLLAAAAASDAEVTASARLFLGLLYKDLGALDRAQLETERASRGLGIDSHQALAGPKRLSGSVTVGIEYDGNVPLTDFAAWQSDPGPSMDGNALIVASLRLRLLKAVNLQLGDTFTYRPQFLLGQFSLLHNSLWLGYRYLGPANQVQLTATLDVAGLGGQPFFIDGEWRLGYRRRLAMRFPVTVGLLYLGQYRNYFADEFRSLTGHTHQLQAELTFGLSSGPLTVSLGYEALREQLREPLPGDDPSSDYRAWAHGPWLHLRGRPHKRLGLDLWCLGLLRRFDAEPTAGVRREDQFLTADLSLTVQTRPWLELFVGGAAIYNGSTDSLFRYVKPLAYAGATFSFAAW
jgi:tetratricopeptide (TPR) repeat protein